MPARPIELETACRAADFAAARELVLEYAAQLGVDLSFQGFAAELEALETMYTPPRGTMILARCAPDVAGCVGVRAAGADAEMKRLYVRGAWRASGLGRRLAQAAIDSARALGYRRLVLDTLPAMSTARGLYASMGFRPIDAYYENPLPGVAYLAIDLRPDLSPPCGAPR